METSTIVRALWERGDIVDTASEYGEPGYSLREDTEMVLLGNWWCHRADCNYPERCDDGRRKIHALEWHYPRTFAALEARGCQFEWLDEWVVVDDKAYRTEADSYSWQPTAVFNSDTCEYMTPDSDPEEWIEWAVNDASRCLMRDTLTDDVLAEHGFIERQCDYESGWYGVDDDPPKIMAAIQAREDVDVLFQLSNTEQFRVNFCVYVRELGGSSDDD